MKGFLATRSAEALREREETDETGYTTCLCCDTKIPEDWLKNRFTKQMDLRKHRSKSVLLSV